MIAELDVEHLAALIALEQQAQSGTSDSLILESLGSQDACVLGWWQNAQLLGYAIVVRLPFDAELQAIGVLPECRRSGAGLALMNAVLAIAQGWLRERLLLEVRIGNLSAIRLYHRCGFSEDGHRRGYYPATNGAAGREDALLMSRTLSSH